jgi:hypothetical protein
MYITSIGIKPTASIIIRGKARYIIAKMILKRS